MTVSIFLLSVGFLVLMLVTRRHLARTKSGDAISPERRKMARRQFPEKDREHGRDVRWVVSDDDDGEQ